MVMRREGPSRDGAVWLAFCDLFGQSQARFINCERYTAYYTGSASTIRRPYMKTSGFTDPDWGTDGVASASKITHDIVMKKP